MNNIRYRRLDATDIERLPNTYQTVLGEHGNGQGQRQLISIARAALANPRILILNETTSSVGTRTEPLIQRAFGQLPGLTAQPTSLQPAHPRRKHEQQHTERQ